MQASGFDYARILVVKLLLKSLIVWLMLLTVPFQGFASATMLLCAPIQTPPAITKVAAMPAAAHDHHAMLMGQGTGHHHDLASADGNANDHDTSAGAAASHHDGSKCNSCASCCFGASMAPSQSSRIPVEIQQSATMPSSIGPVPTVDLALPERPPQASLA
jgi:hypothetical protein